MLSTSAPLAVVVYALVNVLTHVDIITIAQVITALACLTIGLGTYALVRRFAAAEGALAASLIMLTAPSVVLLWSHETYICIAMIVGALLCFNAGRMVAAALLLGFAALMRPEALLVAPGAAYVAWSRSGPRASAVFCAIALAPFAAWFMVATAYFGSPFSQSIAAKRAELSYNIVGPYLHGLIALPPQAFDVSVGHASPWVLLIACCVATAAALAGRFVTRGHWLVAVWALAYTVLYALMRVPFFLWFTVQLAVVPAAIATLGWPREPRAAKNGFRRVALDVARLASVGIVVVNVMFTLWATVKPQRVLALGATVVMPLLDDSPYRELGEWLSVHTQPGDSVAYPEIGQLRYYSGRTIVDFEGLTHPGVPAHLALGDGIWAFQRYRPTIYIDNAAWHPFVDPLEYDWFRRAYRHTDRPRMTRFPYPVTFDVYRLVEPANIPPPDDLDQAIRIIAMGVDPVQGFHIEFSPSKPSMDHVDVRLVSAMGCPHAAMRLLDASGATVASTALDVKADPGPQRVSLVFRPIADSQERTYDVDVRGCAGAGLAPRVLLRSVASFAFSSPQAPTGPPALALSVYER